MQIEVVTVHHAHHHGEDMSVYATEHDARNALHEVVSLSWDNVFCTDGTDCSVQDCAGVPRDVDALERDEAVRVYFAHQASHESVAVDPHKVTIDVTGRFAGLIASLRQARADLDSAADGDSNDHEIAAGHALGDLADQVIAELTGHTC